MKENKILEKNIIMNGILSLVTLMYPLITFPYVSRILLPTGMGKVSFAIAIITYFSMFAQLGIPVYGIRVCSELRAEKEKLSKTVFEIFLIYLITTVLILSLYMFFVFNIERLFIEKKLYITITFMLFFNLISFEWLLKALEKYTFIVKVSILIKVISLILILILVKNEKDYIKYAFLTIFSTSGMSIFYIIIIKKYISFKNIKWSTLNMSHHIEAIFTFFLISAMITLYTNLDTIMLGFLTNDEQVGYYTTALKVKNIIVTIVTSFGTVLLPRLSYYISHNKKEEYREIIKKSFDYIIFISIPIIIYFILYAKTIILIIGGKGYLAAIIPMKILMLSVICIGFTNIIGIQIMVPMHKEKKLLLTVIFGAIIDLIINIYFIPKFFVTASAIATLVAETGVLILQAYIMKEYFYSLINKKNIIKILFFSLISGFISNLIKLFSFNIFIEFFVSGSLFFIVFIILLIITKNSLLFEVLSVLKIYKIKTKN